MRKAAFVALVLGLALGAADHISRQVAEDRLQEQLTVGLDLPDTSEVTISGWPFLGRLVVTRRIEGLDVNTSSVATRSVRFRDVTMALRGVEVPSISSLLSGDIDRVRISSGLGKGIITESDLNKALASSGVVERFDIDGDEVTLRGSTDPLDIEVRERSFVLSAAGTQVLDYELPPFGLAVGYRDVSAQGSHLRVTFELIRDVVRLSGPDP